MAGRVVAVFVEFCERPLMFAKNGVGFGQDRRLWNWILLSAANSWG